MRCMNLQLRSHRLFLDTLALLAVPALLCVGGCVHHDHHDDRDHERVVIQDDHGFAHEGYRDESGWHGGYYDDQHQYHNDPMDWHGDH